MKSRYSVAMVAVTLGLVGTMGLGRPGAGAAAGSIGGTITATGLALDAGALVYVQSISGTFAPAVAKMDQRKMEFIPHILPILAGTTVEFSNNDPVPHIVFLPDNAKAVLGVQVQGNTKRYTFDKCAEFPCAYTVLCPTHPEMEAFILELQNPFFTVSDKDGRYAIENVPLGQYRVGVWHPKLKSQAQSATVESGESVTVDFTLAK